MMFLQNKKGVVLITSYIIVVLLMSMVGIFVFRAITESRLNQREKDQIQALYAAEKGIEYAFIESRNSGWAWHTHDVDVDDIDGDSNIAELLFRPLAGGYYGDRSAISLSGNWYDYGDADPYTGCYRSNTPYGNVEVKAYPNPNKVDETIVLCRGVVGSASRIIKFRITRKSLYQYLLFWPVNWNTGGGSSNYDGKQMDGANIGALHVNGNISMSEADFNNFAEISCSGNIHYYYEKRFHEPISWDDNDGIVDGKAPLPKFLYPPYNFKFPLDYDYKLATGEKFGRLWRSLFHHPNVHIYGWDHTDDWGDITTNGWTEIEGIAIPKQLPDSYNPSSWQWDKYEGDPGGSEVPVRFEVTNEALKWLVEMEEDKGEYAVAAAAWLTCADDGDNNWETTEFDQVTVLSIEKENGPGPESGANPDGYAKGLYTHSEYELYQAVKQYQGSATFPGGLNNNIEDWIEDDIKDTDGFLTWWRQRSYHHKENLGAQGGCFSTDSATVPAYERIFWEAWINYWPPSRVGMAGHSGNHNDIYTPAEYYRAINEEWWKDLEYGNDRQSGETFLSIKYLNTEHQGNEFAAWLNDKGLNEIIKYEDHGGKYETPLAIKANYVPLAQSDGLYIYEDGSGNFTVSLNGTSTTQNSLSSCLTALEGSTGLEIDSWIDNTTKFYNPYETNRAYDPAIEPPHPIEVIQIDVEKLKNSATNINNHIVYIESPTYDTRLINGAALPNGGVTLVSPYDVYLKAQELSESEMNALTGKNIDFDSDGNFNEGDSYRALFNYEYEDKITSAQGNDVNFQATAVITNSRTYFLSSEFIDFNPDNGDEYPYPYNFPNYPYSLHEDTFLQDYCWDNWPGALPKPGAKAGATEAWVEANLDNDQQKTLLDAGEAQWDKPVAQGGVEELMTNKVTKDNYFNVAVASPEEPQGYRRERWDKNPDTDASIKINVEGAFIKLKDKWASEYRSHKNCEAYETNRFGLSSYIHKADDYKMQHTASNTYANYEYEERFWTPGERPSGDFFAGSEGSWQEVAEFDRH